MGLFVNQLCRRRQAGCRRARAPCSDVSVTIKNFGFSWLEIQAVLFCSSNKVVLDCTIQNSKMMDSHF